MKIFISYRREGNFQRAILLKELFSENFGQRNVFLDTSNINLSEKFPEKIEAELANADTIIALIGMEWLSSTDDSFRRRIDSPEDWVHREILHGIEHQKRLVPVYVGGAKFLTRSQLPDPLKVLADIQSYELPESGQWKDGATALIGHLKGSATSASEIRWPNSSKIKYSPDAIGQTKLGNLLKELPDWELREFEIEHGPEKGSRGNELKKTYQFARFEDATKFMHDTSVGINALNHHPIWENIWRSAVVRISTWDIGYKITDRDFLLARYLDKIFAKYEKSLKQKSDNE